VSPQVVVTADRFGRNDYLETYAGPISGRPGTRWLVVGDPPAGGLPAPAVPFDSYLGADPVDGPLPVDPGSPAIIGFTSGTTRDPKRCGVLFHGQATYRRV
jgi:acyl-CoA synthetase